MLLMAIKSVSPDCGCARYTYNKERNSTKDAIKTGAFFGGVWGAIKKPTYYKGFIEAAEETVQNVTFSNRPNNIIKGAAYGAAFMFLLDCVFGKNRAIKRECIVNSEMPKQDRKLEEVNVVNLVNVVTDPKLTKKNDSENDIVLKKMSKDNIEINEADLDEVDDINE